MSALVSVIIPTHNRANLVPRAIRSVLGQTYANIECIVVDDGSSDNTAQAVQQFADNRLIYLRHDVKRYASAARNTGIAHSKGDLIAFLDDDDEWLPTKLEKQVAFIQTLPPEIGMVYCWMDYFDSEGQIITRHHPEYRGYLFPLVLGYRQYIGGCPTLLVRRAVLDKVVGFDESLPRGNDGDFIRRVCRHYAVDFIPEVLVKVHIRHGHGQISQNNEYGIRNHIKTHLVALTKFKSEYDKYPEKKMDIYADIALNYSKLGKWRDSILFLSKAFVTYPFSFALYIKVLNIVKVLIIRWIKR